MRGVRPSHSPPRPHRNLLARPLTRPPAQVSPSAAFQKDLGLDSLDTVELVMALEEEFAIEVRARPLAMLSCG